MAGLKLLQQARRVGLRVWADGGFLEIEGPPQYEHLAKALLAAKEEVLAELEDEHLNGVPADAVSLRPEDFRIRTVEDLLGGWGLTDPPSQCFSCSSTRWWRLAGPPAISRPWICGACHPPAVKSIEWFGGGRA